jgi:putative ABC transport system permease protein
MIFRRKRKPSDFTAEIETHIKLETDRLREQGLSDRDAEAAARRAFGNPTISEERFYEKSRWLWLDHLHQDLRYAFRLMAKNPTLSAIIVLTLALGIGANSVIFSVVRAVVLRPLDYREPDRLVQLWDSGPRSGGESDWVSFPDVRDWRRENRVFEDIAAYNFTLLTMTGGGHEAESVLGLQVTDRLFSILGVDAALGRTFLPGEDAGGHENVVVISHALWQRRFDSDPAVAGKPLNTDGRSYTVVGVMPPSFRFPNTIPGNNGLIPVDLWIPMLPSPALEQRGSHNHWAIARLKQGVTLAQARAGMDSIARNLARQYPGTNKDMGVTIVRLQDHVTQDFRTALVILLAAVGLVLLIACANIGNLLLSRAESRRREMATREALGAGRGRLIQQTLTESLLLAIFGGLAGLVVAHYGTRLLLKFGPATIPRFQESTLDMQVLLFTAAIAIGSGVLFGLAPALLSACSNVYASLKEAGTRSTTGSGANQKVRSVLVAGEMALAVMVLVTAGLLIRSFIRVVRLDPGFHTDRMLSAIVSLPQSRYADPSKQAAFFEEALRRIHAIPGVQSAAVSDSVPLTGINNQGGFRIEGWPAQSPGQDGPQANRPQISTGYFETMGIKLLQGRLFDQHDRADSPFVAVVSDLTVKMYWPHESPIGKRVSLYTRNGKPLWRQIVGVVHATRHFGLEAPQKAEIYFPHTQAPSPFMLLVVRAQGDPHNLAPAIRREIGAIDPEQSSFGFQTMDDLVSNAEGRRRFQVFLLAMFAGLALLLAAIGIYGVISYTVTQRTREIGVRLALGAAPRDVVSMVVKKGLVLSMCGMAVGFAGSVALTRVIGSLLFEVSPLDVPTFAGVAVLLIAVSVLSAYLPGRGAAHVDPLVALREE